MFLWFEPNVISILTELSFLRILLIIRFILYCFVRSQGFVKIVSFLIGLYQLSPRFPEGIQYLISSNSMAKLGCKLPRTFLVVSYP